MKAMRHQQVAIRPASIPDVGDLLLCMREGDRHAAATFIDRYGDRIRRRVRGKLSPRMRRLFDSQEILSTVARRLDLYVRDNRLAAANLEQLWALIFRITENSVADKVRVLRRLDRVESPDSDFAAAFAGRLRRADEDEIDPDMPIHHAFEILTDQTDRTILALWLNDLPHTDIGECVGLTANAVRQRWHTIRGRLHRAFVREAG